MPDVGQAAKQFIDALNAHDETRIREGYAENVVFEAPGGIRMEGRDAATEYAMSFVRAFPDVRLAVANQVEGGDWVAFEITFEGTHQDTLEAPAGAIPATNRRITGKGAEFIRIEDGKVAEEHLYFDQVEFLTQLGVMEQEAATA
ncbi:MAG: ester cyclase [Actinomycetota bacterium]|jgi:steroid delta-isomerase-like uncharacterized protein|nr:ester cyclase [Actinomycetota bacterium]